MFPKRAYLIVPYHYAPQRSSTCSALKVEAKVTNSMK